MTDESTRGETTPVKIIKNTAILNTLVVVAIAFYLSSTFFQTSRLTTESLFEQSTVFIFKAIIALVAAVIAYKYDFKIKYLLVIFFASYAVFLMLRITNIYDFSPLLRYAMFISTGLRCGAGVLLLGYACSILKRKHMRICVFIGFILAALVLPLFHNAGTLDDATIQIVSFFIFSVALSLFFVATYTISLQKQQSIKKILGAQGKQPGLRTLLQSISPVKVLFAFSGACLFSFGFGLFEPISLNQNITFLYSDNILFFIAIAIMLVFLIDTVSRRQFTDIDALFIVVCILCMAAFFGVLVAAGPSPIFFAWMGLGATLYELILWIFFIEESRRQKISAIFLFGLLTFAIVVSRLIGRLVAYLYFSIMGSSVVVSNLILAVLFAFFLALLIIIVFVTRAMTPFIEKISQETTQENKERKYQAFCEYYHLSKREIEIVREYAAGRSSTYISNKLYLSQYTIKTHLRRIYVKLDIHSKQELINLLEQFEKSRKKDSMPLSS